MNEYKQNAFLIVKTLCDGKTKDIKAMHAAYQATQMSTVELRTMMQEGRVYDINDALKIIENKLK
jgi:hypothetical protein